MAEKAVGEKIAVLTQLMQNPDGKDGSVLRIFYDIFQLTHGGLELPHQTEEWLNQIASRFLSEALLKVLTKLRLEVYGFKFAALNLIDIDDVIDDLSHDASRLDTIIPPGSYNKLKQELIGQSQNVSKSGTASLTNVPKFHQQSTVGTGGGTQSQYILPAHIVAKPHEPEFKFSCNLCHKKLRSHEDIECHVKGGPHFRKVSSVQQNQTSAIVPGPQRLERNVSRLSVEVPRVQTGESDEELVYSHRAQLFCFSDGEWKELCVGEIKILRHKSTGTTRFFMKRKETLDVCLNHEITSAITFRLKDDKSWLWAAQDFSDSVGKTQTFWIRFRDAETSKAFMAVVLENQDGQRGAEGNDYKGFVTGAAVAKPASNHVTASKGKSTFGTVSTKPVPFSVAMKAGSTSFGKTSFMSSHSTVSGLSLASLTSSPATGFDKSASFTWPGAGKPIFDQSTSRRSSPISSMSTIQSTQASNEVEEQEKIRKSEEKKQDAIKFESRCNIYHPERASTKKTWSMSGADIVLKIVIDADMLHYLIIAQDANQQYLCNTMITGEDELKVDGTVCTWSVSEYSGMGPFHRSFLAQFSSTDVAHEFKSIFDEGKEFAEKSNVYDASADSHAAGYHRNNPPGKSA